MNRVRVVVKIARNSLLNQNSKSIDLRLKPRLKYSTSTLSMQNKERRLIKRDNQDWQLLRGSMILRQESSNVDIKEEIDHIVKNNKVVLFMKGVPDAPRCGFSNAVCQILRMHGVEYDSHDVLEDESLRQGIKEYSQWPTIPQVYINGQFVGGCDVLLQLHQSGDLIEELEKAGIKSALLENPEKK